MNISRLGLTVAVECDQIRGEESGWGAGPVIIEQWVELTDSCASQPSL